MLVCWYPGSREEGEGVGFIRQTFMNPPFPILEPFTSSNSAPHLTPTTSLTLRSVVSVGMSHQRVNTASYTGQRSDRLASRAVNGESLSFLQFSCVGPPPCLPSEAPSTSNPGLLQGSVAHYVWHSSCVHWGRLSSFCCPQSVSCWHLLSFEKGLELSLKWVAVPWSRLSFLLYPSMYFCLDIHLETKFPRYVELEQEEVRVNIFGRQVEERWGWKNRSCAIFF